MQLFFDKWLPLSPTHCFCFQLARVVSVPNFRLCRSHLLPLDIIIIPHFCGFVKRFLKISAKILKRLCYSSLLYCSRESLWLSLRSCDHFCNRPSLLTYLLYHTYRELSIGNNQQSFKQFFVQSAKPHIKRLAAPDSEPSARKVDCI